EKSDRTALHHDIAVNRRARHDFHIDETVEAGLVLLGSEVKALRAGKANLKDSYARVNQGEAWLLNAHISAYAPSAQFGDEPTRTTVPLLGALSLSRSAPMVAGRSRMPRIPLTSGTAPVSKPAPSSRISSTLLLSRR